jgi:protein TonB
MKRKVKKAKSSIFFGFILSLGLHLFLILTILFWGFSTPASIKKPQFISGRLVTLEKATRSGPKGSSRIKRPSKPKPEKVEKPKVEKKPEVVKKKEPEKIKKPEVVKKPPKKQDPPKPKPPEKNVVDLNQDKKPKPKPTPKPVAKSKDLEKETQDILEKIRNDKARRDVLANLKKESSKIQVAKVDSNPYDITGSDRNLSASTNSLIANRFVEMIRSEIAANWNIPPNIPTDGSLESKVFFRIDEYGKVFDIRIEKSSGNSAFDEFCKRALRKASPLNAPPPEILHEAKTEGVEVSFSNNPSY